MTEPERTRRLRRAYMFDPTLDILVIVCIAGVIAQRSLRAVPEVFAGGAIAGEVLAALALSYTGAWFFNLLVIRLPKGRDKVAFAEVSGNLVAQYASTAVSILQQMANAHGMTPPPRQPDEEYLKELLAKVDPMGDAPLVDFQGRHSNWIQHTHNEIERAAGLHGRLVPFFPQMEASTVAAIAAVENTNLVQTIKLMVASPPMRNEDMSVFAEGYLQLWTACAKVGDCYLAEIAPLLEPEQRLHIDH